MPEITPSILLSALDSRSNKTDGLYYSYRWLGDNFFLYRDEFALSAYRTKLDPHDDKALLDFVDSLLPWRRLHSDYDAMLEFFLTIRHR